MRNDALYRGRRKFDLYVPQRRPTQDDRQDHRSHAGYGRGYVDACVRRLFFLPVPTHLEPSIDGDRIKVFAHLCKRAGEALKLAVISPERRRLQSLLAPETGTDAQRVYLFRGCAGDSRKAA